MNSKPIELSYKALNKTDYFLVLLLVLFAGLGNSIFRDIRYSIIPIAIVFFVFVKKRRKFTKSGNKIYGVFILYIFAYFIKYWGEFDPMFTYRIFTYITFSYLVVSVVGYNFFKAYENVILFFALISLPLFLLEATTGSIYPLLYKFQGIIHIPYGYKNYTNVLLFSIRVNPDFGYLRNCGFCWEPGGFANFLILAIIINLARNKFNLKNKRLWVLLIAMITTFTTTGYMALMVISIWYLYNVKFERRIILIPVVILLAIYISTLPFMAEKIKSLSADPEYELNRVASISYQTGNAYSIGRFAGFLMNMKDFKQHPIIGYGGHGEETWQARYNIQVASINGLGRWMAMFGSIGIFIFFYTYIKSLKNLSLLYNFKKPIILLGVILVLGFAFGLIQSALFFAFMLSFLILPASKNITLKKNMITTYEC